MPWGGIATELVVMVLASGCSLLAPSDEDLLDDDRAGNTSAGRNGAAGSAGSERGGGGGEPAAGGVPAQGGSAGGSSAARGGSDPADGGEINAAGGVAGGESSEDAGQGGTGVAGNAAGGSGGTAAAGGGIAIGGNGATGGSGGTRGAAAGAATGGSGGTAGNATGTVPRDGLILWLDAEQGVVRDELGAVSRWGDQSGNARDAEQSNTLLQPRWRETGIGTRPAIEFDGAGDFLALPAGFDDFSAGLSFFAMVELFADANCPPLLELSNANADRVSFLRYLDRFQYEVDDEYARATTIASAGGDAHLFTVIHGQNELASLYQDRLSVGTHAGMSLPLVIPRSDNRVGASQYSDGGGMPCLPFDGTLGEMLLFDRALDETERQSVEAYLADKWGEPAL